MSALASHRDGARAAVSPLALHTVCELAPDCVEVIELRDDVDLATIDFLVPHPGSAAGLHPGSHVDRLQVVQVVSAGTDPLDGRVPDHVTVCSARGARDAAVAEWVIGALLGATTGLLQCARQRAWHHRSLQDLAGATVLVVGMGSIGRAVGERLGALDAEVVGVASHAREDLYGVDELPRLLGAADAVVVLTPLTDATRGLIGAAELAAMADGAVLVNAGRGPVVDTLALLAETESGRLRAVLDVTDPEPLPRDHPLWQAPGVLAISPHMAGDSPRAGARAARFAGEQLRRWYAGEPLQNVIHH